MKENFKKYFFILSSLFFILINNELTLKIYAFEINNKNQTQKIINEDEYTDYRAEYILGPGDGIKFELLGLPEFSGEIFIGPDGNRTLFLGNARHSNSNTSIASKSGIYFTYSESTISDSLEVGEQPLKNAVCNDWSIVSLVISAKPYTQDPFGAGPT